MAAFGSFWIRSPADRCYWVGSDRSSCSSGCSGGSSTRSSGGWWFARRVSTAAARRRYTTWSRDHSVRRLRPWRRRGRARDVPATRRRRRCRVSVATPARWGAGWLSASRGGVSQLPGDHPRLHAPSVLAIGTWTRHGCLGPGSLPRGCWMCRSSMAEPTPNQSERHPPGSCHRATRAR